MSVSHVSSAIAKAERTIAAATTEAIDAAPLVVFDFVSKAYDEAGRPRAVLSEVNLEVSEGEFVAIVGRSGSGKSTLLNLVAGLDEPSSGEVIVAGRSIGAMSERERTLFRRMTIGFVYQFFNLIPTLDVLENVRLPLELLGRRGADADAAAMALLEEVGLADRARSWTDRLSGGEQQRVAIARALAAGPRLVLADEPTGNLDADTGQVILDLLQRSTQARGKTLLVATHSRAVGMAADRVFRIEAGRLVAPAPSSPANT